MQRPEMKLIVSATLAALTIAYGPATHAVDGDDGVIKRVNVSKTPLQPTEFANVQMAKFYVNAQDDLGNLVTIDYKRPNGDTLYSRTQAKPLFATYNDGAVENPFWINPVTGVKYEAAFAGHGKRNVYSAVSRDDGSTWMRVNLSSSGQVPVQPVFVKNHNGQYICEPQGNGADDQALQKNPIAEKCDYFIYGDDPVKEVGVTPHLVEEITAGGGDVVNVSQAVVGNDILVAWVSRDCSDVGTSPLNTIESGANPYGVLGIQGYIDYGLTKAEGEIGTSALQAIRAIGKVPFACVWTRRGRIVEDTATGGSKVNWWAKERLTSGVRDAWKLEVAGQENGGFAVVWQEDPEGLLSGSGEGPGEGWSGSTVNHKTDVWYSYLRLADFGNPAPVMSIPVPITDNAKCPISSGDQSKQFCYADNMTFTPGGGWSPGPDGTPDLCADGDLIYNSCIAQDGRFIEGQTGASRPRINLQAYCPGNDDPSTWASTCTTWSAWAAISYEESKGKGDLVDEHGVTLETGKNIRFATFEIDKPEPVKQHLQLNAPTKRWPGGPNWSNVSYIYNSPDPAVDPDLVNKAQGIYNDYLVYRPNLFGISIWNAPYFDTEIARRASITSQGVKAAYESQSETSLLGIFKQGLINQGGPADIMFRRFVLTDPVKRPTFNPGSDNPFAIMACNRWATADELGTLNNPGLPAVNELPNPNYLDGLCLEPAHNASGTTPTRCDGNMTTDPTGVACGYENTNPFIYSPTAVVKRVFDWTQTQGENGTIDNRADESWSNPWDVAKGHRGILDGDFIMLQYAWAPNEYANAVGRDAYNLYIRRSFDGGQTWTTTPSTSPWTDNGVVADGTNWCETYRRPIPPVPADSVRGVAPKLPVCTALGAGVPEPARNLSLITLQVQTGDASLVGYPARTVLDPRYTPTGGLLKHANTDLRLVGTNVVVPTAGDEHDATWGDTRNPSKYFIAYDDGDNTTVAGGAEAEPVNMYYTQAYNWGDEYTGTDLYFPLTGATVTRLQLLNAPGTNASESSITGNPDGSFLYSIWNQWQWSVPGVYEDPSYEFNEDAYFRRVLFLDGE
jgi:hypothetical protein